MNNTAVFWPMLAHVLLVYIVYALMGLRRAGAVRSGEVLIRDFRNRGGDPDRSVTVANNLMNQFELPVLFHVLCLALYVTAGVNTLTLILLWLFIATRYVHAFVHVTSNRVRWRSRAFMAGAIILLIAWIWFALHIAQIV